MNHFLGLAFGLLLALCAAAGSFFLLFKLARTGYAAWKAHRSVLAGRRTTESQIQHLAHRCITHSVAALKAGQCSLPNRAAAERRLARQCSTVAFSLATLLRSKAPDPDRKRYAETFAAASVCLLLTVLMVSAAVIAAFVHDPLLGIGGAWLGFAWMADYLPENAGPQR